MKELEFPPAVELLTSSVGGSIHILRFLDNDYFRAFCEAYIETKPKKTPPSLEFAHLVSEGTSEEVLLIHTHQPELHFHGGPANLEHVSKLCSQLPFNKSLEPKKLSEAWRAAYRQTKADKGLEYLLSIRERALKEDTSLFQKDETADLEGYEFLKPTTLLLMGPPNAGKSTFFNYLVGEQRALISEVAGTTRDALTATLQFGGHEVLLVDTAGLRESMLQVGEQEDASSIQGKSEELVQSLSQHADLFCIFNTPEPPSWIAKEKMIPLKSKADLNPEAHPEALSLSIHQNQGCDEVVQAITERIQTLKKGRVSTRFSQEF